MRGVRITDGVGAITTGAATGEAIGAATGEAAARIRMGKEVAAAAKGVQNSQKTGGRRQRRRSSGMIKAPGR